MSLPAEAASAAATIRQFNQAWQAGRLDELASMLHSEIVMAPPGFAGRAHGREAILAGFRDYCEHATTLEFHEHDLQADVIGDVAIVTFRYDMVYERAGERTRASGRDLWVLQKHSGTWLGVWRTMSDMEEHLVQAGS
jgi:ketosteroid isomerase-like protein